MRNKVPDKSKTVSVLLAVFLSYWSWLYTYKLDAWKFWTGLGISVITLLFFWLIFPLFFGLAVWVWVIIDVAIKDDNIYNNYQSIK